MIFKQIPNKNDISPQCIKTQCHGLWQDAWQHFKHDKLAIASTIILLLIGLFLITSPALSTFDYTDTDWEHIQSAPSFSTKHYFGTDALGRDLFVRVAIGGRISLAIGIIGAFFAVVIGTIYGAISGYFGGKIDILMMRFLDILNALPFMFFVILLITIFGRNIFLIFVAIGLVSWLDVARIVRGQTLSLRHKEYIQAAYISGASNWMIIVRHIIPNLLGVVMVYASLTVPNMILLESFLSFLGLGIQEPMTSWGTLLQDGSQSMQTAPWELLVPAIFLVSTLFCFYFIGDGLRDALDPKDW